VAKSQATQSCQTLAQTSATTHKLSVQARRSINNGGSAKLYLAMDEELPFDEEDSDSDSVQVIRLATK